MAALYPIQTTFVRGEISPRLHARADIDLYRAALSKCTNLVTLPHGGIRKRGGTYFVGEVKASAKATLGVPFIFSSDQAYWLEFGDQYVRVYAYGVRVGTVEVATPYLEADLFDLDFVQSADQMWITHRNYLPKVLTRTAHTAWTLEDFDFLDGPYDDINETGTTMTPAQTGAVHPIMTSATAPSGTVTGEYSTGDEWKVFTDATGRFYDGSHGDGWIAYDFPGTTTKICDAYWVVAFAGNPEYSPISWTFEGFDGTNWIVIDTRAAETGWTRSERRFYDCANKVAFQSYRIKWTATDDSNQNDSAIHGMGWHESGDSMTPFDLTASSVIGINDDAGFQTTDVGRAIRLLGSDGIWRWAKITGRTSSTVVKIRLYGHSLPDTTAITRWRLGTFVPGMYVESGSLYEERLAFSRRFSVYASATGDFDNFAAGEKDADALEFVQAGGGQANNIQWIAESDGALLIGTSGGIRALSGSGIDEALTPSSFKNRRSRTYGCAKIRPIDAGQSFLYVTRSRKAIAELTQATSTNKFTSDDIGQISEHIPKKGIVQIAYQTDPDPILWFPLEDGEIGGYTHQPSQDVRGMHIHQVGGSFAGSAWGIVESAVVTPGQTGIDDVWLIVKRTIGGVTKRYIEIMQAPFEYGDLADVFAVDCGLTYTGAAVGTVSGLAHLNGDLVDALVDGKVYKGLTVAAGQVTLPGGATGTKWQVGLPFQAEADTLELDVGGKDGSIVGRRKKVARVIMSLFETDTTGLSVQSFQRGRWEPVRMPSVVAPDGKANLFTGNVEVPIDDSWEGQGRVRIRHTNPTPCTIRAFTPVFDSEP